MKKRQWNVRYEQQYYNRPMGFFGKLIFFIIVFPFIWMALRLLFRNGISDVLMAISRFFP